MKHMEDSGALHAEDGLISYQVQTGIDGKRYAVFRNSYERDTFCEKCPGLFDGFRPACFGQFDNAFCLE